MFPLYANQGFTYENLSEIRPTRFETGVAALLAAGLIAVGVLASSVPTEQAGVPDETPVYGSIESGPVTADAIVAAP